MGGSVASRKFAGRVVPWCLLSPITTQVEGYDARVCSCRHNYDKTGLFFKMLPDRSLSFSNKACTGGKHCKQKVTVMVGTNAVGTEKLPLLCCFKGKKNLTVWCSSNTKAWLTQSLFEDYLRRPDRMFEHQKRPVVILVDNCGAHGTVNNLQAI